MLKGAFRTHIRVIKGYFQTGFQPSTSNVIKKLMGECCASKPKFVMSAESFSKKASETKLIGEKWRDQKSKESERP